MENKIEGNLIIIGGAEDKTGEKTILKLVSSRIKSKEEKMVIVTVATENPEECGNEYKGIFKSLNVNDISILNVKSREDAHNLQNIQLLNNASVVFFTGGDQLRITSILGGTPLYKIMKESYRRGCTYVGTSAGASVMSDTMIVSGPDDESPKKCTLKMAPGLGLIRGVIIDQHFAQRGRIGRLLVGVAENPETLGIGIDEDTAIVVNEAGEFSVIGSGAVYVLDGADINYSNVSEQHQEETLSIFNIKLHILKSGNNFNTKSKSPYANS